MDFHFFFFLLTRTCCMKQCVACKMNFQAVLLNIDIATKFFIEMMISGIKN